MRIVKCLISIPCPDLAMLREDLCLVQASLSSPFSKKRIQNLIDGIDYHRPLDMKGKHGDLHTDTCGCDTPVAR